MTRKQRYKGAFMRYWHRRVDRLFFRSRRGDFRPSGSLQLRLFDESLQLEFDFSERRPL